MAWPDHASAPPNSKPKQARGLLQAFSAALFRRFGVRATAHAAAIVWTAIRICPVTVLTKSAPRPSQRVIGFAGRCAARSAPNAEYAFEG